LLSLVLPLLGQKSHRANFPLLTEPSHPCPSAPPPPPTHPDLVLPFLNFGGHLPSPNCAKSPQFFLTAPGDSRLPTRFSSSPLLRHLAHLPHLLLHPQDLSELTASDHAPPPPSNASASDRTTTSTLLCHSGELHRLPPCPAGRSCPINALPRCRSPPHQLSCRRWSGHRASLVRGDRSSARANRAGVTS
jgi:hypothetical protein